VSLVKAEGEKIIIRSANIKVGHTLYIEEGQEIPADLIMLTSSDKGTSKVCGGGEEVNSKTEQAQCFIQTSSLDGEKNLKKRLAPKNIYRCIEDRPLPFLSGSIECDMPNRELYEFKGSLSINSTNKLSPENRYALSEH